MMSDRDLGLLGLGARAGTVVIGTAGVRAALQRDQLALVVVAGDHGPRTADKVLRLARARRVRAVIGPEAARLGRRVGRGAVQAIGVRDPQLASAIGRRVGTDSRRI